MNYDNFSNKDYLRNKLNDYVNTNLNKSKNGAYCCPLCRSGEGKNKTGAFRVDERNQTWKCFSCGKGGDIYNLVEYMQGLAEFKDKYNYVREYYGLTNDTQKHQRQTPKAATKEVKEVKEVKAAEPTEEEKKAIKEREKYIKDCNLFVGVTTYFSDRGLTDKTIKQFQLGYYFESDGQEMKNEKVIIPYQTPDNYYITRLVKEGANGLRYIKLGGLQEPIFNQGDLFTKKIIFVTEGQIDAISLLQEINNSEVGAIAIGGTGKNKLINLLKAKKPECKFIVALDNDEPGEKAAATLINDLESLGLYTVKAAFSYDRYTKNKDCNDLLVSNVEQFRSDIQNSINLICELVAEKEKEEEREERKDIDKYKANYLLQAFKDNVYNSTHTCISTGFENLDYILDGGLYSGLYFLGACSSLGKTTLLLQLADQIAAEGQKVLYFSIEMSQDELISKSLSRYTYKLAEDEKHAKTSRGITDIKRYSNYSEKEKELINKSINTYQNEVGENLYIYERESKVKIGVDYIREKVDEHLKIDKQKPIIFIDYLQILAAYNENATDKRIVDENVTELKILSRDYNIPIICISSLNRDSYTNYISMQAFKESGSIEYGSDYLLALQPLGMKYGSDKKTAADNIEVFNKCKHSKSRDIQLLILKNRNGALQDTTFKYHTLFNCFIGETDFKPISEEVKEELKQERLF